MTFNAISSLLFGNKKKQGHIVCMHCKKFKSYYVEFAKIPVHARVVDDGKALLVHPLCLTCFKVLSTAQVIDYAKISLEKALKRAYPFDGLGGFSKKVENQFRENLPFSVAYLKGEIKNPPFPLMNWDERKKNPALSL